MDCSQMTYRAGLQQLSTVAQSLKASAYAALCKAGQQPLPSQPSTTQDVPIAVPPLLLPIPNHITSTLTGVGCPVSTAQSLSDAFVRSMHEIRSHYELTFRQTCTRMAHGSTVNVEATSLQLQLKKLGSAMERQYRDRIHAAKQLMLTRARSVPQTARVPSLSKQKPVFNQEFVPLLEKYFEYNAYPSAPDRTALARKSMMTPRQIEVWFQNHRNRAKKEGKTLRKLTTDPLPLQLSLESLKQKMPFFIIPPGERKDIPCTETSECDSNDVDVVHTQHLHTADLANSFDAIAPPHAFPTTYPSSCRYYPFPCKNGSGTLPAPVWMRTPATSCPVRATLDFDDFITDFATKLALRDTSHKRQVEKSPSVLESRPWFSATQPFPAPHPAFIRPPVSFPLTLNPIAPLPMISAPSSCRHPFRSPSPNSPPTTMVSLVERGPVRRKHARLHKRIPGNKQLPSRPQDNEISYTSSSPSTSRTPSLTSITSLGRRSSSSSCSSSGPSTPISSPTSPTTYVELPYVSGSEWDFGSEDRLFGDSSDRIPPGVILDGISSCQREQLANVDLTSFPARYVSAHT